MKESGRDYLNVLVHTMPKYMDNIFISAKIERFNFQDNHKDSLKLIILKVLFYCFAVGLHPARTFWIFRYSGYCHLRMRMPTALHHT